MGSLETLYEAKQLHPTQPDEGNIDHELLTQALSTIAARLQLAVPTYQDPDQRLRMSFDGALMPADQRVKSGLSLQFNRLVAATTLDDTHPDDRPTDTNSGTANRTITIYSKLHGSNRAVTNPDQAKPAVILRDTNVFSGQNVMSLQVGKEPLLYGRLLFYIPENPSDMEDVRPFGVLKSSPVLSRKESRTQLSSEVTLPIAGTAGGKQSFRKVVTESVEAGVKFPANAYALSSELNVWETGRTMATFAEQSVIPLSPDRLHDCSSADLVRAAGIITTYHGIFENAWMARY